MSYDDTIRYLYDLQKYGIKFGLENITRLMSALRDPHSAFPSVHVAGTNGKGSASAIIASILQAAGFRTGLFTSPHLVSFTERIRINGREISENDVIALAGEVRDIASGLEDFSPTFFEVVTAMAMLYFRRNMTDIAVIEVGMGGRLDATNIVTPEVSVITGISYDHREFLGSSLADIAREKAGILKKTIPVAVSGQEPEVLDVLENIAREQEARLFLYGRDFSSELKKSDISGIRFDYHGSDGFAIQDLALPLPGEHQMQNASVAVKAIELLSKKLISPSSPSPPPPIKGGDMFSPSPLAGEGKGEGGNKSLNALWLEFIREGIGNVRWPGRLEFINDKPPVVIDGAHNPGAATVLARTLKKVFLKNYKKIIIILGIMDDKDIKGIMEPLLPVASEIILTAPAYSRSASPEKLAGIAKSLGFSNLRICPAVKNAIDTAMRAAEDSSLTGDQPSLIVVSGSFYTIGEAKEAFGQKGVLSNLRE
jgi:dihydrofolate synthase/folylpolyglutamate synthase